MEEVAGEWEILQGKCIEPDYDSDLNCAAFFLQRCLDRHTVWTEEFMSVFNLPWAILG